MHRRFTKDELRELRNDVDIRRVIVDLLQIPTKNPDGIFRFLCPLCSEFNSATNPKTNLARCFRCERNFNPIDIVIAAKKLTFVEAVEFLLQRS